MDTDVLPRMSLKVGKGISLHTAHHFLHEEGFRYTKHKKALYFDGHERLDVVDNRQNHFLPLMAKHHTQQVEFMVGDVEKVVEKIPMNFVERRLVLCAH